MWLVGELLTSFLSFGGLDFLSVFNLCGGCFELLLGTWVTCCFCRDGIIQNLCIAVLARALCLDFVITYLFCTFSSLFASQWLFWVLEFPF